MPSFPTRKDLRRRQARRLAARPLSSAQRRGSLQAAERLERREVMAGDALATRQQSPGLDMSGVVAAMNLSSAVAPAAPQDMVIGWSESLSQGDALSFRFGETPREGDTWCVLENGVPIAVNTRYYRGLATDTWETEMAAVPFDFTGKARGALAVNPIVLPSGYPGMRGLTAGNRYEIRVTRGTQSAVGQSSFGRYAGVPDTLGQETQTGTIGLLDLDAGGSAPAGVSVLRGSQGEQVAALVLDAGKKISLRIGELGTRLFFSSTLDAYPAKLKVETNRDGVVTATVAPVANSNEWMLTIDTKPLAGRPGMVSVRIVNTSPDGQTVAPRYLGVIVKDSGGSVPARPEWLAVGAVNTNDAEAQKFFRGTNAADDVGFKAFDTQYIYLNDGPLQRPATPITPTSPLVDNPKAWRTASGGIDGRKLVQSLREAVKFGAVPQVVYYNIMTPDESKDIALANLQNRPFLVEYFKDLKFTVDVIRQFANGSTVALILEPDLLAYMMQSAYDPVGKSYRDPATIVAMTDAAYEAGLLPDPGEGNRLPNTLPGFVEAINRGVRHLSTRAVEGGTESVNLEYGWKFNLWAYQLPAGGSVAKITDALGWTAGRATIEEAARATAAWYVKAGILTGDSPMDFIALDKYGTDGGATGDDYPQNGPGYTDPVKANFLWNADHWNNYLLYAKTLHNNLLNRPVRLWQMPVGHVNGSQYMVGDRKVADLANVHKQWEDSAVSYFFGDQFSGLTSGRIDPAGAQAYFAKNDANDSLVSQSRDGTIIWGSHMAAARDAGIESIMFGPGLANSTQGGGYQGPALDGYFWAAKATDYLKNPLPIDRVVTGPGLRSKLTAQPSSVARTADGSTPTATVTITRTGDLAKPLSLPVRVVGGSADPGFDFRKTALERQRVWFAAGQSTALLVIPTLPTRTSQPRETLNLAIGGASRFRPAVRTSLVLGATPLLTSSTPTPAVAIGRLVSQMRAVETFSNPDNPGRIEKQLKAGQYPNPYAPNVIGEVSGTNGLGAYPRDGRNTPGAFQVDLANMGIQDVNNPWRETFGEWLGAPQSRKGDSVNDTRIALSKGTLSEFFGIEVDAAGLITKIPAAAAAVFLRSDALAAAPSTAWNPTANPLVGHHIDNFQEQQLSLYLAGRSALEATTGVQDPRLAPQAVMDLAEKLQQQVARSFMFGYYQKFQNHPAYKEAFAEAKKYFGATLKITASTGSFGVEPGEEFWCRLNGSFIVAGTYVSGEGSMNGLLGAFVQAAQTGSGVWRINGVDITFTRLTPAGTAAHDAVFAVDKTPLNHNPYFPSIFHYGAVVSPFDEGIDWNDKAAWGVKDRSIAAGLGYARLGTEKTVTGPAVISEPGRYAYSDLASGQTLTLSGAGPFYIYGKAAAGGGPVLTPEGYGLPANNGQQVGPGRRIDIAAFGLSTPQQVLDASFYGWYDGGLRMAKVNDPSVPDGVQGYLYFVPAAGGDPAAVLANQAAFYDTSSPYYRSARVGVAGVQVLGRPASADDWARNFIIDAADNGTGVIDASAVTGKVLVVADDTVATVKLGSGSTAVVGLEGNVGRKTYVLSATPTVGSGTRPFLSLRPGDRIDASRVAGLPVWTIDNRDQKIFDNKAAAGTPYLAYSAFSSYSATDYTGGSVAEFAAAVVHAAVIPDPAAVIREGFITSPALGLSGSGADGDLGTTASPVAQYVYLNEAINGVKGWFTNRTAEVLHVELDYLAEGKERDKLSLKPGERFSFLVGGRSGQSECFIEFRSDSSNVTKRVDLNDPAVGWASSNIESKTGDSEWETEGKESQKEGDVNRIDRAPFDVSVKRENDQNRGIVGEGDDTEDWANFDVYVDAHDAVYARAEATIVNKWGAPVHLRAFQGSAPLGPDVWLGPNASHVFSVPASGSRIEVYYDGVWMPVQVLEFDCRSRQSSCEVRSTYGHLRNRKPATLSGTLSAGGTYTHLDSPYVGTYAARLNEVRDPSGGPRPLPILFELHTVPTWPIDDVSAMGHVPGNSSEPKPVEEFVDKNTVKDGVKGRFFNRTAEVMHVGVDLFNSAGTRSLRLEPGEFFTYVSGAKAAVEFRVDSSNVVNRVFLADPSIGWPKSDIQGKLSGQSKYTLLGRIHHSEGEINRIDRVPFDVAVKRENDGNRGITGERGATTAEWANLDVYVDAHDALYSLAETTITNKESSAAYVRVFQGSRPLTSVEEIAPNASRVFSVPATGSRIEIYNWSDMGRPAQILDFSCMSRQRTCEVRSTYLDLQSGKPATLRGSLASGGTSAHLDSPYVGTYVARLGEVRDASGGPRSLRLLFELHRTPTNPIEGRADATGLVAMAAGGAVAEIEWKAEDNDGVKGRFFNRSSRVEKVWVDIQNGYGYFINVGPGEYFSYVIGAETSFEVDTSYGPRRIDLKDPDAGYPTSALFAKRWASDPWNEEGKLGHSEGEVNRSDKWPFDISVKREDDGNRGIKGEGKKTEEWANFDIYFDDFDTRYTEATANVVNRTGEILEVAAFHEGRAVGSRVRLDPGAVQAFTLPAVGSTIQVYLNRYARYKPVQILEFGCASRQSPCEVRSTYVDSETKQLRTLSGTLSFGGESRLDAPGIGTYAYRSGESADPARRVRSPQLLFELHTVPFDQL